MLIPSRLLSLLIIATMSAASPSVVSNALAETDTQPTPTTEKQESLSAHFPFKEENRVAPIATTPPPEVHTTDNLVEDDSKPTATASEPVTGKNNHCVAHNNLQKSLLIMAFSQLKPTSANAGNLYQAEHELPQLIRQHLTEQHTTVAPEQLSHALADASLSTEAQLAQQVQRLASRHRSQFIVSGEIVDMSMSQPHKTYNPGLYTRFLNGVFDMTNIKSRFDKRDRLFSFELHLRDGFTGQPLFSKRYDTYGIWRHSQPVGFATPLFWQSDYGEQIKGLVQQAAVELGQAIACQPFIAQVDSRPGQTQIILQGGASNGLHAGDMLSLYQLVLQGSETRYQEHDVRLVNRNTAIELREVYASHSVGVISSKEYLAGQFLAVAP